MAFKFLLSFCALIVATNAGNLYAPASVTIAHRVNPAVDAVASTQQNVVRTYDGTVTTYSKQVQTPYSSFSKIDSRTTNNVYPAAVAKTVTTYAAPVQKTFTYAAPAAKTVTTYAAPAQKTLTYASPAVAKTVTTYAAPVQKTFTYAAPAVAKTVTYAAPAAKTITYSSPAIAKTVSYPAPAAYAQQYVHSAPAPVAHYQHSAPVVYTHAAPAAVAKTIYTPAPTVAAYTNVAHVAAPVTTYSQPIVKQAVAYSPAVAVSHVSFDGFGTHWGF